MVVRRFRGEETLCDLVQVTVGVRRGSGIKAAYAAPELAARNCHHRTGGARRETGEFLFLKKLLKK